MYTYIGSYMHTSNHIHILPRAKVAEGSALHIPLGKGKDRSGLEYVGTISIFFLSLLFSFLQCDRDVVLVW